MPVDERFYCFRIFIDMVKNTMKEIVPVKCKIPVDLWRNNRLAEGANNKNPRQCMMILNIMKKGRVQLFAIVNAKW